MKLGTKSALGVGLLIVLLLLPIEVETRLDKALMDLAHAPLFALIAALVYLAARQRIFWKPLPLMLVVWLALVSLGGTTEIVQYFVGRTPSWEDVWADGCGAAAGVVWAAANTSVWRSAQRAAAVGLLVLGQIAPLAVFGDMLLQRQQMPIIGAFEHRTELLRWQGRSAELSRSLEHVTEGEWSLRVELLPGRYPSVALNHPPADWSAYQELTCDVHLYDGPPLLVTLKVQDQAHSWEHDDRFHQPEWLKPGWNHLRIRLDDVRRGLRNRTLNLRQITFWQLFTIDLAEPRTLHLDNVRLK